MRTTLRRLSDERGMALVMALMIMMILAASVTTTIYAVTSNSTSNDRSNSGAGAYQLAESGINRAAAILNDPANNALQQATLPSSEPGTGTSAGGGSYKYWGVLNTSTQVWTVYGKGIVASPNNGGAQLTRTLSATVQVTSSLTQPLNNQAWNYIFSTKTGDPDGCDEHVNNNFTVSISMYVAGNLCIDNNAAVIKATGPPTPVPATNLIVQGSVTIGNNGYVGTTGSRINQALIKLGCNGHSPCRWNGGGDAVWATTTGTNPPTLIAPVADYAYWYQNASPGPKHPCTSSSGTPPTFENEAIGSATMNKSVPTTQNLTPASSYTCTTAGGALSWNATTRVLTVSGAMFIDGNVSVSPSATAQYNGQASLYVKGTLSMSGSFCGGVSGGSCDFAAWNPNTELLLFIVDGTSGGYGVTLSNGTTFQGGIYATSGVLVDNNSNIEGPIVAANAEMMNNAVGKPFPIIDTVPLGTPGNPNVYAEPQPPTNFSG